MNHDIVTITLNPAIDQTVFLDRLTVGKVNRTTRHHRQAGGKGINVSSMLGGYGLASTATGFLGKDNPRIFTDLFKSKGIRDEFIKIPGETRTGIKVGYKPAGGISKAKDALLYQAMMKDELGHPWLQPDLFRFGASSLLGDIERQLEHHLTGRYSAANRHAMG